MERGLEPRVEGGRLYGRGAYDMKGGLAAILLAAAEAQRRGLPGDVVVAAVADEEHASLGTAAVLGRVRADAAIVTEPTGMRVSIAHRGFASFAVEVEGVAAHGSRPDLGVDAIARMGRVLAGIESLERELSGRPPHPLLGRGSIHAGTIEGGEAYSVYPARCRLTGERRTLPHETDGDARAELAGILERAGERPDFRARLALELARPAFAIDRAHPLVGHVRACAAAELGAEPGSPARRTGPTAA
ncbi:MAG: M20/M25/M40 family metallo-hydrolase [Thermoleophilia bacterium]